MGPQPNAGEATLPGLDLGHPADVSSTNQPLHSVLSDPGARTCANRTVATVTIPLPTNGGKNMSLKALAISFAVGAVTTWATGKVVKELDVPAYAAPLVGTAIGMIVNNAARRLH